MPHAFTGLPTRRDALEAMVVGGEMRLPFTVATGYRTLFPGLLPKRFRIHRKAFAYYATIVRVE